MNGLGRRYASGALPGWAAHRVHPARLGAPTPRRRLVLGRLSHYSALYEVQHEQGLPPLDAVQHLHHMVHGGCNATAAGWNGVAIALLGPPGSAVPLAHRVLGL